MSLLHEHRGLPPADSRVTGLDRELDLAAERPIGSSAETSRGPGLLVASIVASSLALAGIISLVRGTETDSAQPEALASEEGLAALPIHPVPPEATVRAPTPALASAVPSRVARPTVIRPSSVVPPPPQMIPATVPSPGSRDRTRRDLGQPSRSLEEPAEPSVSSRAVEEPAPSPPVLAEPPVSEEPSAPILPGVVEPSIFEPELEAEATDIDDDDEPPPQDPAPEAVEPSAEPRDGPVELHPGVVEVEPVPTPV